MHKVICLSPVVPIRKEPNHRSEQTSQLLFGEKAEIISENNDWIEIRTLFDSYRGWVDKNSIDEYNHSGNDLKTIIIDEAITICNHKGENIYLTAGSEIGVPDISNTFQFEGNLYKLISPVPAKKEKTPTSILETAMKFINAPYLWGGRNIFGIDCSGFVQIVYKIHGIILPRDTKDQANTGKLVESFSEIVQGDLVFFDDNEGKITHVGIAINVNLVIHASLCVKIDKLDQKGIFNLGRNEYTHSLKLIRRIL
jgi:cell wall-associated NlpC family hydrolase